METHDDPGFTTTPGYSITPSGCTKHSIDTNKQTQLGSEDKVEVVNLSSLAVNSCHSECSQRSARPGGLGPSSMFAPVACVKERLQLPCISSSSSRGVLDQSENVMICKAGGHEGDSPCEQSPSLLRAPPHEGVGHFLRAPADRVKGDFIYCPSACNIRTSACDIRTVFPSIERRGTMGLAGATASDQSTMCTLVADIDDDGSFVPRENFVEDVANTSFAHIRRQDIRNNRQEAIDYTRCSGVEWLSGERGCRNRTLRNRPAKYNSCRDVSSYLTPLASRSFSMFREPAEFISDRPIAQCHSGSRAGHCIAVTKKSEKSFV